ncbi:MULTISPECIES: hypothetical protein [Pseudomonas]|jgi:hypothetical protein|uniref:hypothetical protein n=1 Tax=Pseudomonas TaxID=286 RepID=UPI0011AF0A04|nr:hypothetical protein [Pseudomonas putida]
MKSARKLFAMALAVSLVAPGYLLAATDTGTTTPPAASASKAGKTTGHESYKEHEKHKKPTTSHEKKHMTPSQGKPSDSGTMPAQ